MNMRLRPYKPCDATTILSWVKDEDTFRKWVTDRYPNYPITEAEMNHKYLECNGDCMEPDNFYPMTACCEGKIVGHLIMRFTDAQKTVLRFGFVIVDDSLRGAGYGKKMLLLALKYAFEIMKVRKVTIGVLENNPRAYHCYKAVGFRDVPMEVPEYYHLMGANVKCLELECENKNRYKVITLCGSTRFEDAFMDAQKKLTLEGNIVISVGLFGHSGDSEVWEGMSEDTLTKTKIMLDDMHKRKIDMADEIFVINVGGYIGSSTRSEIEYANTNGKPVRYLEESHGSL